MVRWNLYFQRRSWMEVTESGKSPVMDSSKLPESRLQAGYMDLQDVLCARPESPPDAEDVGEIVGP